MDLLGLHPSGRLARIALVVALLVPGLAQAQTPTLQEVPAQEIVEMQWRFLVGAGGEHQFETSIDGGGEVSVSEVRLGLGGRLRMSRDLSLRAQLAYEYASYDFSGSRGLSGLDPWGEVHTVGLSSTLTARFTGDWRAYAGFRVKASGEPGADFGDAITVGGLAGVSYRVGDRLTLGAGFTISERLEDDPLVLPLLSMVWIITDQLRLRLGSVDGAWDGAGGLELEWQALPELELTLGGRSQNRQFRLDDSGVASGGVGRDRSKRIYGRANWQIARFIELSVIGGMALDGELQLEDRHGHKLRDEDYDPAPFASLRLTVGF